MTARGAETRVTPGTCKDYLAPVEKGFFGASNADDGTHWPFIEGGYTLRYLQQARPPQGSYLPQSLSTDRPNNLPPLAFRYAGACNMQVEDAIGKGITWHMFDPMAE